MAVSFSSLRAVLQGTGHRITEVPASLLKFSPMSSWRQHTTQELNVTFLVCQSKLPKASRGMVLKKTEQLTHSPAKKIAPNHQQNFIESTVTSHVEILKIISSLF